MSAGNGDGPDDPSDSGQTKEKPPKQGHTSERSELSIEDVRFLRTVRDISESPEEYPQTEQGVVPATTGAVRETTTLSRSQIKYRMEAGSNVRGFEDMGLLVVHDPPMTDAGYGQRSVELTEKGEARLNQGLRAYGLGDNSDDLNQEVLEQVENMGARIDDVERQLNSLEREVEEAVDAVESMSERLERYEERSMGVVDEQQAARLRTVIDAMPAFYQAFQLMGMDVREIQESDELNDRETEALVENVRSTLDN